MAKKVLVVSTSLRGNSNSEILATECERGAKDAGNEVEFVSLRGKDMFELADGLGECPYANKMVDVVDVTVRITNHLL